MEKNENEETEQNDIKIILVGETAVGKTNLINVFFGFGFQHSVETTYTSYCFDGDYNYKEKNYKYSIWDTAGQEKFRSLNKLFIRDAKIILIVYSIDFRHSFEEVDFWINYVKENETTDRYIIALVANKSDLIETQTVMDDEGQNLANKYGIEFSITSALKNAETFKEFVNHLIEKYIDTYLEEGQSQNEKTNNIKINDNKKENSKKKKCCEK